MARRKNKKPIKILSLDTETFRLDGAIRRIAFYDGSKIHYGYNFSDIFPSLVLLSATYDLHIYIHNLEFDARKMPEIFSREMIDWDNCMIINNKYVKIKTEFFTLHDSFAILPKSLASLSKDFDLEHGKLDLWDEVQKMYPNKYKDAIDFLSYCDVDDELYMKYLGYDVLSLYELVYKLMDVSGIEENDFVKCLTTASISKRVSRLGFKGKQFITEGETDTDFEKITCCELWHIEKGIKNNYSNQVKSYLEIENLIREGYCGGRTEVFKPLVFPKGEKINAFHYDVNSLYPSVMIDNIYPIGYPSYYDEETALDKFKVWQENKKGLGFLKCKVFIPDQHIPPLPSKIDKKLCFPTGFLTGVWTYIELEYAMENCGVVILEGISCVHFDNTFKVFKNYIKTFSDIKEYAKETGQKALTEFTKLMMNVSYGWTCLRRDDKTAIHDESKIDNFEDEEILFHNEKLGYFETFATITSKTIQCQIGSYVTSYARLVLLKALKEQDKKGEVYYCDTDSIVSSEKIDDNLCHRSKLGFWDLEGEIYEAIFIQPKVYCERKKPKNEKDDGMTIKFKGVTKKTQEQYNMDFYKEIIVKLQTHVGGTHILEKKKELLRSIRYAQKKDIDMNLLEIRDKCLNLENKQKRNIDYMKNITTPINLKEGEQESYSFKKCKVVDFNFNM